MELVERLREAAEYADSEFSHEDARLMREAANILERLRAIVALADGVIMDLTAFPLPGDRHRPDCLIIRSASSEDFYERKRLARTARQAGPL